MKGLIVVDIETTGILPFRCSILQIGAVDVATGDEFDGQCRAFDGAQIDVEALGVNGTNIDDAHDTERQTEAELVRAFLAWVQRHGGRTLAGMNPHFDLEFLRAANRRAGIGGCQFSHRLVDLHTLAYARALRKGDDPGRLHTDGVYALLGLPPEPRPHNALTGARREYEALLQLLPTHHDALPASAAH